jgi:hypothetical protein
MSSASALPGVLHRIARVAGIQAAWEIVNACGGVRVYIPAKAEQDHWLTALVGFDAAAKICEEFRGGNSGCSVEIPLAKLAHQQRRLMKALEAGMSTSNAARVSGMHQRTVYRAKLRLRDGIDNQDDDEDQAEDNQFKLF